MNISTDADLGTIYSVAVPIKRVKPVARVPMADDVEVCTLPLLAAWPTIVCAHVEFGTRK